MESTLVSAIVLCDGNVSGASLLLPYVVNVLEINDLNWQLYLRYKSGSLLVVPILPVLLLTQLQIAV